MKKLRIKKSNYIKIERRNANDLLKLLRSISNKVSIIDKKKKVLHENNFIFFPISENFKFSDNELFKIFREQFNIEIIKKRGFENPNYKCRTIEEVLKNNLSESIVNLTPKSYDIIGKIAIVEFDQINQKNLDETEKVKREIASAIISVNMNVKTVYEKKSEIKGDFRLRDLKLLYGNDSSETMYKENNCLFKLDVKKTYFTPRLIYEHKRISSLEIKKKEVIIDLFAGVGPFSIQIARKHDVLIYSFDFNPIAYNYLKENININKLKGIVYAYNLNVKELLSPSNIIGNDLRNKADRIILNLPENSIDYLEIACFLLKPQSGILHVYQFCEKPDSIKNAISNIRETLKNLNWSIINILESRIVKAFSPKSDLVVVDILIKKNGNNFS
ncbi:MAG: class I SAM-dependent methyltransferase family protein [Candidatus Thorarchaeota archaeon]